MVKSKSTFVDNRMQYERESRVSHSKSVSIVANAKALQCRRKLDLLVRGVGNRSRGDIDRLGWLGAVGVSKGVLDEGKVGSFRCEVHKDK